MASDFEGIVPEGTLIEVLDDSVTGVKGAYCRPVDYGRLEETLVSEEDRTAATYHGFTIVLSFADVGDTWRVT